MSQPADSPLDEAERLRRYARHLVLAEIGTEGQEKLLSSKVLVIGAGGLGSAALAYLAAAGVGTLGIIEHDRVELSNLQRQLLYEASDIGRHKVDAAKDRLEELNEHCYITAHQQKLTADNAMGFIENYDLVLDGSDNFATRFAVADACMRAKKPLISAAISAFSAQLSTFKPYLGDSHPCYGCFVPETPEREISCEQEGIIGPLAGMMGSMQAIEAIKELLGIGKSLSGRIWHYDALSAKSRESRLTKVIDCPHCKAA